MSKLTKRQERLTDEAAILAVQGRGHEAARKVAEAIMGFDIPEPQNDHEAALELFVLSNECFECGANMEGEETCWSCGFTIEW